MSGALPSTLIPDGTVQVKNEMEPKFEDLVIYNFVFLGLPLPNTGSENFVKQAVHRWVCR